MSVSCALIPVALAMRIIMGKKNFEKWVKSKQVRIKTNCTDKQELIKYIITAGYDANNWGSSIKTHMGKKDFFFWDFIDGRWVAIFSKSDSQEKIQNLIKKMEAANKTKIFTQEKETIKEPVKIHQFPTNFQDKDLLIKTLTDYGINTHVNGDRISFQVSGANIDFYRTGTEPYTVELRDTENLQDIYSHLSLLDDDYIKNVQSLTYDNLMHNLEDRDDLYIESEDILDDDSIVISVVIQD